MSTTFDILHGVPERYRATADVGQGALVLHNGRPAIVHSPRIAAGEVGEVVTFGPFIHDGRGKQLPFAIREGDEVFYDFTAGEYVTADAPNAVYIGIADIGTDEKRDFFAFTLNATRRHHA